MANEPRLDDLRNIWRQQPVEDTVMTLEQIRDRAVRFERRINRRNMREYIGGMLAVAAFTFQIWKGPDLLMRIGAGMLIAGVLLVMWRLHQYGGASPLPEEMGVSSSLAFHRRQLVRQRDLLRSVFRWYLAPLIPGLLVSVIGALPRRGLELRYLPRMTPFLVLFVAAFWWIWWINKRAADRLERQIAELDQMGRRP